ncbi:hypothetical protein B0T20DRAFT_46194 [Sordaria brevicollis]|uniref:Fibroin-3 n=1 Tax=Sordaria brevicollis TaxID=83679 RepID=A0AAE0P9K2_SORBR|nr:hypothetical protein B0T20DRAFT_46194 [Sordaria brevicollis]
MPTIDIAMRRSVQEGLGARFLDLLARSIHPALQRRNVADDLNDVKTAFSSWDNCMQVDYCKWTAIGLMIFAGLVIFSICWCIGRCLCCGLSCCCECFRCLQCCGNCCGCCDPPGSRKHKYLDAPFVPPDQGYKAPEPMDHGFGNRPAPSYSEPSYSKQPSVPQYAEFDVSKKRQTMGDSLPAMPEWEGAGSKKVLVEEEAVELDQLKKPEEKTAAGAGVGAAAAGAAVMTGAAAAIPAAGPGRGTPGPSPSPGGLQSPYGAPASNNGLYGNNGGYGQQNSQGYNQMPVTSPYGQSPSPSPYGMAASTMGPAAVGSAGYNAPGGYSNQQQDAYGRYGEPTRNNTYDSARNNTYDSYGTTSNGPASPYDTSPYDNYDSGYGNSQQPYGSGGLSAGNVAAGMGIAAGTMGGGPGGPNRVRSPPAAGMNSTPYPQNPMTRRSPAPEQQLTGLGYGGVTGSNSNNLQTYEMPGDDSFLGGPRHHSPAPQSTGITGDYDGFSNQGSYSQGSNQSQSQRQNTFGGNNAYGASAGGNGYGSGASYGDIMRSTPSPAPTGPLPKPPVRNNTMGVQGTLGGSNGGSGGAGGGGFDFSSGGYSRPGAMDQQQQGGGGMGGQDEGGYPGYKPYSPVGGGPGGPGGGGAAGGGGYRGW